MALLLGSYGLIWRILRRIHDGKHCQRTPGNRCSGGCIESVRQNCRGVVAHRSGSSRTCGHVGINLETCKKPDFAGELTHDQKLRLSALVGLYKSLELYFNPPVAGQWVKRANRGPEFDGQRPVDAMIHDGLPKILRVRAYVDALRGGV